MTYPASICVFCGASNDVDVTYLEAGRAFGKKLADHNMRLVYGGGDCGVMGAIANSVLAQGGKVTGVFPQSLQSIESEHQNLTEIIVVETMHQRKEIMYQRSTAFVVFPGGFGTMDEMFEILTWKQLRLHNKPIIIMNHEGYWDHLIALMDKIVSLRFAKAEVAEFYQVVNTMDELMLALAAIESAE